MSDDDEDTAAIADAREGRELLFIAALGLASRVIAHVDEHALAAGTMDETFEGQGYSWHVMASYGKGHGFVRVIAHPVHQSGLYTQEELAVVMGNQEASFDANVPRAWIELAQLGREKAPCS